MTAPQHPTPEELTVEVFRSGDYGPKGRYREEDLDALASDYDPAAHEAPVTLDHAQQGPAHGWVKCLSRVGDRLVATIARISPALATLIRNHAYKKRSVELYRQHPETGRPYLKAVSFLGAAVPEVKGLADPRFAESDTFEDDGSAATPRPFDEARRLLISRAVWRPQWEQAGLPEVFDALGSGPAFDALVEVLATGSAPPVPFGEQPREGAGDEPAAPVGASPESIALHRRALQIQATDPALDYRAALLAASRGGATH